MKSTSTPAVLTSLILTILSGCIPEMPITPGPDSGSNGHDLTARQIFDQEVHSITIAKCDGCHDSVTPAGQITPFVDKVASKAYDRVVGFTALVGDFTPTGAA